MNICFGNSSESQRVVDVSNDVIDIRERIEKIREAGYQTQTDYIWKCADIGRSFLFYDQDGNMIQIWQNPEPAQPKESPP